MIDLPFSQDNARELYGNPAVGWLREQIDESTADRGNFSQGSSSRLIEWATVEFKKSRRLLMERPRASSLSLPPGNSLLSA